MFYLGLDPSLTSFGVVLIDGNTENSSIVQSIILKTTPIKSIEERIVKLSNNVFDIISKVGEPSKNLRIAIEGLSFGSRGQAFAELGALHYFLRILFMDNKLKYQIVPPTKLKKFVCGTGRAKKDLMLLNAYKKFKVSFESSDICDAYCLARMLKEYPIITEFGKPKPKSKEKSEEKLQTKTNSTPKKTTPKPKKSTTPKHKITKKVKSNGNKK